MVEKQIDVAAHIQPVLAPHERESGAQFEEETRDVLGERALDVAFLGVLGQAKEVEDIRILERVAREIGLRWRQALRKVGDRIACARVRGRLDLHGQHITRPAAFERFGGIPVAMRGIFDLVEQGAKMEPRQLCSRLLHKFRIRPGLGKGAHVFQVARRETSHIRECGLQVARQLVHDGGSPSLLLLPLKDVVPDLPVQLDQLPVCTAAARWRARSTRCFNSDSQRR
ncbi:MAG TPA: hypothetical protein VGE93_17930 [Bryobacteraceae bacterium]